MRCSTGEALVHILSYILVMNVFIFFCYDWTMSTLIWRFTALQQFFLKALFSCPHLKARTAFSMYSSWRAFLKSLGVESAWWVWIEGQIEEKNSLFKMHLRYYLHGQNVCTGRDRCTAFLCVWRCLTDQLSITLFSLPCPSFVLHLFSPSSEPLSSRSSGQKEQQLLEAV